MHLHEILSSLSTKRPVFHSEADFQHALAWEIHLTNKSASIRLEQQISTEGQRVHIDLLVKNQTRHIAIELKYKTKHATITCGEEQFRLRNHSARDVGRYDFLKDIVRIEQYVATQPASEGYVVFLTNDQAYWQISNNSRAVDAAFRIHEGRNIHGEMAWGDGASDGTMLHREKAIQISGAYCLTWQDFSLVEQHRFRYALIHVPCVA
jgi:hypothetical protein